MYRKILVGALKIHINHKKLLENDQSTCASITHGGRRCNGFGSGAALEKPKYEHEDLLSSPPVVKLLWLIELAGTYALLLNSYGLLSWMGLTLPILERSRLNPHQGRRRTEIFLQE